uniref:MAM domain-containing protein n=1 Tax=Biomphalaria glabrata TaxID=6526 RepID=A0A2C9KDP3_BIOGL
MSQQHCLTFFYQMYGADIGTLNVYQVSSGKSVHSSVPIWSRSYDMGPGWRKAEMTLDLMGNYQLIFEGIVGSGYRSDIALDDIVVKNGACPNPRTCSFSNDTCLWRNLQDGSDDFDWLRNKGETASFQTGPSSDHTSGGPGGYYMYIESSNRRLGERARLASQVFFFSSSPAVVNLLLPTLYDCNFESGFCGWVQDTQDQFDWSRSQGPTGSTQTGPLIDHTKGTAQGWYAYIEASTPRVANDSARLISQVINPGQRCLRFYYVMYGTTVYQLNVYVQQGSQKTRIFRMEGEKGLSWLSASIPINPWTPYQLVIEGVRGSSWSGDIAIDDITVPTGTCPEKTLDAGASSCTFENLPSNNSLCGYTQETDDNFDWSLNSNGTQTQNTGPYTDHTYGSFTGHYIYTEGSSPQKANDTARIRRVSSVDMFSHFTLLYLTLLFPVNPANATVRGSSSSTTAAPSTTTQITSGHYAFIEASAPQRVGDRAYLASQRFSGNQVRCLHFFYNMFGQGIGTLNVYMNTTSLQKVWSLSGPQGRLWSPASVSFNSLVPYQIIIEGTVGSSYEGDIAIDDIFFSNDNCAIAILNIIEASNRAPNLRASLLTPNMTLNYPSNCVKFWYNMYGSTMGSLRVYRLFRGNRQQLWSRSGNQGQQWQMAEVSVSGDNTTTVSLEFEGVVGSSYLSDIALDDVSIRTGPCDSSDSCNFESGFCTWANVRIGDNFDWIIGSGSTPSFNTGPQADNTVGDGTAYPGSARRGDIMTAPTRASSTGTTPMPSPYDCTFESASTCTWTQSNTDQFDWSVVQPISQGLVMYATAQDHTQGTNQGFTLHLPTSQIRHPNDTAALTSPSLPPAGALHGDCLSFWYRLYGPSVDGLQVYTVTVNTRTLLWQRLGSQGPDWRLAQVETTGTQYYQYQIVGLRGTTYLGATDVDDIHYSSSPCPFADFKNTECIFFSSGPKCLHFWYHMFGFDINTLNMYTVAPGSVRVLVWTRHGAQANDWLDAAVTLQLTAGTTIQFEGVRGTDYQGDIAIDDISLIPGTCVSDTTANRCDFETDMCGYRSETTGLWQRWQSSTSSIATGPTNDHTYGTSQGHYAYAEASSPRMPGDKVRMIGLPRPATTAKCVSYYYHMYGVNMGTLEVRVRTGPNVESSLYTHSGNLGDKWYKNEVTVRSSTSWQLIFESTIGNGYASDIAIDDIVITDGSCGASEGSCDFETNMCTWSSLPRPSSWLWTAGQAIYGYHPSVDHTLATSSGKYLLLSYKSNLISNKASLASQPMPPFNGIKCFTFWYLNSGPGSWLTLYLTDTSNNNLYPIWSQPNSYISEWSYASVPIGPQTSNYIMEFDGQVNSTNGYVAIDDFVGKISTAANCPLYPATAVPVRQPMTSPPSTTPLVPFIPLSKYDCSFESDFCNWTQEHVQDTFDWVRAQGPKGSAATGPVVDHSYGTDAGWYAYITSSYVANPNQAQNQTAWLVSPMIPNTVYCFNLWYHMYGSHVGSLNIYKLNTVTQRKDKYASQSGNHGSAWQFLQIKFTGSGNDKIIIEGVRGTNSLGDIAIDDIMVQAGSTCHAQLGPSCSFDFGDCGWNQSSGDIFNWQKFQGSTTTVGTGPVADHTLGTQFGYYYHIDARPPRVAGDYSYFVSQTITGNNSQCVRFWYSMNGDNVGTLEFGIMAGDTTLGPFRSLWSRSAHQSVNWLLGESTITYPGQSFHIVFKGTVGNGIRGDIAIDDITLSLNECPFRGNNDFENGLDLYTNSVGQIHGDKFDWVVASSALPLFGVSIPFNDHTLRTQQGHFAIAMFTAQAPGNNAYLYTPIHNPDDSWCFTFYYYMTGQDPGMLNVYLYIPDQNTFTLLWSLNDQKDNWNLARIPVSSPSHKFQLVFEANVGTRTDGMIALDDIVSQDSLCTSSLQTAPPNTTN